MCHPAALGVCHAPFLGVSDVWLETLGVLGALGVQLAARGVSLAALGVLGLRVTSLHNPRATDTKCVL